MILCQILRGLGSGLASHAGSPVGGGEMAHALVAASDAARRAVMQPAEGTILTVAAAAAVAAGTAAAGGGTLLEVSEAGRVGALEALWRTPEQLPVLATAGVVDAGGAGLVLLFDGLLTALDGRPLPGLQLPEQVRAVVEGAAGLPGAGRPAGGPGALPDTDAGEEAFVGCRYEVMYLLEAPDEAIPAFREVWAGLGESIVLVGGDGLWSCHIHTDEIGASIEAALDAGRPREIRVTDLAEQVEEESWVREETARVLQASAGEDAGGVRALRHTTDVVAVASGDGIRRIFRSLGVGGVVAGGQSMNPSTAEVLDAIERAPSREVVVLPNNSNIVPVAEQAAALSDKHVVVVPTRAIQEGFAALLEYDPEAEAEENAARMKDAARRVVTGEVTKAVRASNSLAGPVAAGSWIGLDRDGIVAVSSDLATATCDLLAHILDPAHELVTLFEGAGANAAATRRVSEWLTANHPGVDFERHVGGQPLYPYLVTVE